MFFFADDENKKEEKEERQAESTGLPLVKGDESLFRGEIW
jgi:hypothetical protein